MHFTLKHRKQLSIIYAWYASLASKLKLRFAEAELQVAKKGLDVLRITNKKEVKEGVI